MVFFVRQCSNIGLTTTRAGDVVAIGHTAFIGAAAVVPIRNTTFIGAFAIVSITDTAFIKSITLAIGVFVVRVVGVVGRGGAGHNRGRKCIAADRKGNVIIGMRKAQAVSIHIHIKYFGAFALARIRGFWVIVAGAFVLAADDFELVTNIIIVGVVFAVTTASVIVVLRENTRVIGVIEGGFGHKVTCTLLHAAGDCQDRPI